MHPSLFVLVLTGCAEDPVDTGKSEETGITDSEDTQSETDTQVTDTEDSGTTVPCTTTVVSMLPEDGTVDVYYRDALEVVFDADAADAVFTLSAADGSTLTPEVMWGEGNLRATLYADLVASTTYTLGATICDAETTAAFTTSELGTPLTMAPEDLVGRVYMFRIADAEITEPSILEYFDDAYLTSPLLFEVSAADASMISLMGALGADSGGEVTQVTGEATWDFPNNDFSDSPTFSAYSERIVITYDGTEIPIEQFTLSGTFKADASAIAEGHVTGLVDTRDWGTLMGLSDEPDAVCVFAEDYGVHCEPCSDGENLCLYIVGEDILANYQEGVDLEMITD